MKQLSIILISTIVLLVACKKDPPARTSGTVEIETTIYQPSTTPYVIGFSFPQAKSVKTNPIPDPDIIILVNGFPSLSLQVRNSQESFFKVGDYESEDKAKKAFDDLKTVQEPEQWLGMADNIAPNQVWVYRSDNEKYTKIRIVKTEFEILQGISIGKCEFQWVHQPDGSVNFP